MIDYKLIGNRIKNFRVTRNLTQEEVAEQADISIVYLSKIENGRAKPTLEVYAGICSALKCDLASIFCNASMESKYYQCDQVLDLFQACSPKVKPIALQLLQDLAKL